MSNIRRDCPYLSAHYKPIRRELSGFWARVSDCAFNALSGDGVHAPGGRVLPATRGLNQHCRASQYRPELTHTQNRLLGFLRGYIDAKGHGPTYREIETHMGWTHHGSTHQALVALERKGKIRREARRAGGIEVT